MWDSEFEQQYFTPDEIEESRRKSAMLGKYLEMEQRGEITHDEAMIELFADNPDYADELLSDVVHGGDLKDIRRVKEWYDEAKYRNLGMVLQGVEFN